MQHSLMGTGLVCAVMVATPAWLLADSISSDVRNGFFAPLMVVEDHPQCSGPGQSAFEIAFDAAALAFAVETDVLGNSATVDADGEVTIEEERCFVTQRSGVEAVQVEIRCGEGQRTQSPFGQVDLERISLSVSGQFLACQSPLSFDIIDSEWSAEVSGLSNEQTYEGAFFEFEQEGCDNARIVRTPEATLIYSVAGVTGAETSYGSRLRWAHTNRVVNAMSTHFVIGLTGIPILDRNGEVTMTAHTTVTFFPTIDGQRECRNGTCSRPTWLRLNADLMRPKRCQ